MAFWSQGVLSLRGLSDPLVSEVSILYIDESIYLQQSAWVCVKSERGENDETLILFHDGLLIAGH